MLLAPVQGILLSVALLIQAKKREVSNIFLALILFIISLELLTALSIQMHYMPFPFWLLESYLVLPPSVLLFIQANANPNFQLNRKQLLLYVPALIEIVVETTNYIRFRMTGKFIALLEIKAWFIVTELLPMLCMVIVLFIYGSKLSVITKQTRLIFTPGRLHTIKVYSIFITLSLLTICWFAEVIFNFKKAFLIIEVTSVLVLLATGYIGYAVPVIFNMRRTSARQSNGEPFFSNHDDQKELQRLTLAFQQNALHTRPGLTVEELAGELNLPVKYVSYLINTHHQTNFHHFVNIYRIKEVIRKMEDPAEQHKTLLALARESGFNSKSSFNQVFKSHTGKTPSQYLK